MLKTMLFVILLTGNAVMAHGEWTRYWESPDFTAYYDNTSIEATRHGDIKVQVKKVYTDKGREALRQQLGFGSITRLEEWYLLDCGQNRYNVEQSSGFDQGGGKLFSEQGIEVGLQQVIAGSPEESLINGVCRR